MINKTAGKTDTALTYEQKQQPASNEGREMFTRSELPRDKVRSRPTMPWFRTSLEILIDLSAVGRLLSKG